MMSHIINNIGQEPIKRTGSQNSSLNPEEFANHSDQDFDARYQRLMDAFGVKNETDLGRALGIKQQSIAPHRKKRHIPSVWFIIAAERGVSVDWILYGEGPMRRGEAPQSNAQTLSEAQTRSINVDFLQFIITAVDTWLHKNGRDMDIDKKAELIALLYDYGLTAGSTAKEKIIRHLELVA